MDGVFAILLGLLLYVICIQFCCRYIRRAVESLPLKPYEEQMRDLKTEESTQYSKAA
jgi:hypothetical protein